MPRRRDVGVIPTKNPGPVPLTPGRGRSKDLEPWSEFSPESNGWGRPRLVDLLRSFARNSGGVFGEPFPHLLVAPRPLERVGVEQVVLRPGDADVIDELLAILPRRSSQIAMTEGSDQQL